MFSHNQTRPAVVPIIHSMVLTMLFALLLILISPVSSATLIANNINVFINEIHYDNRSTDAGEFIEIAGPAGFDLTGWSLYLYNGGNQQVYEHYAIATLLLPNQHHGFGFASFAIAGIQNGAPDGVVLADASNNVIQFLSYEGAFMAADGIALGLTSTDIGVSELSNTLRNFSLQLGGIGQYYQDFSWQLTPIASTAGQINTNQQFSIAEPTGLLLFLSVVFLLLMQLKTAKIQLIANINHSQQHRYHPASR